MWCIFKTCINLQCPRTHNRNGDDNPGDWQAQDQREEANGDRGGDRGFRWVFLLWFALKGIPYYSWVKKMRFFHIPQQTWLFLVCWNIHSDIVCNAATLLLWRWRSSTDHFCYKTSWRWVWESESYSLSNLFRDCQCGPSQMRKGDFLVFGFEKYSTTIW